MDSFDLVVKNGRVLDPASRFEGQYNLGIRAGKLAALTTDDLPAAAEIDALGCVVCPGFVDIHSHPDGVRENGINLVCCGVTTAIGGNCGTLLNINQEDHNRIQSGASAEWYKTGLCGDEIAAILDKIDLHGYPVNLGMLVGAGQLRLNAGAADENLAASPEQVQKMVEMADHAVRQGALGISFGLAYTPGTSFNELKVLCLASARQDTILAVHLRYDGPAVMGFTRGAIASLQEIIAATQETGCKLQISHIGHMIAFASLLYDQFFQRALSVVEQAIAEGLDIMADSFPFAIVQSVIKDQMTEMLFSPQFKKITGREVVEYAVIASGPHQGKILTPELYAQLLEEDPNTQVSLDTLMRNDLLLRSILPSWVMVCSDSALGLMRPSQPYVLGHMVREQGC